MSIARVSTDISTNNTINNYRAKQGDRITLNVTFDNSLVSSPTIEYWKIDNQNIIDIENRFTIESNDSKKWVIFYDVSSNDVGSGLLELEIKYPNVNYLGDDISSSFRVNDLSDIYVNPRQLEITSINIPWGDYINISEFETYVNDGGNILIDISLNRQWGVDNVIFSLKDVNSNGSLLSYNDSGYITNDYVGADDNVIVDISYDIFKDLSDNNEVGGFVYDLSVTVIGKWGDIANESINIILDRTKPVIDSIELFLDETIKTTNFNINDKSGNVLIKMTNEDASDCVLNLMFESPFSNDLFLNKNIDISQVKFDLSKNWLKDLDVSENGVINEVRDYKYKLAPFILRANTSDWAENNALEKTIEFTVTEETPYFKSVIFDLLVGRDNKYINKKTITDNRDGNIEIMMTDIYTDNNIIKLELNGIDYSGIVLDGSANIEIPFAHVEDLSDNNKVEGQVYDLSVNLVNHSDEVLLSTVIKFIVDRTNPIIKDINLSWGKHLNALEDDITGIVNVNTTPDASGETLYLNLNGKKYLSIVEYSNATIEISPLDLQNLSETEYTINIDVSDNAGNSSDISSITFTVDITPPIILLFKPNWGVNFENPGNYINISETLDFSNNIIMEVNEEGVIDICFNDNKYFSDVSIRNNLKNPEGKIEIPNNEFKNLWIRNVTDVDGSTGILYDLRTLWNDLSNNKNNVSNDWNYDSNFIDFLNKYGGDEIDLSLNMLDDAENIIDVSKIKVITLNPVLPMIESFENYNSKISVYDKLDINFVWIDDILYNDKKGYNVAFNDVPDTSGHKWGIYMNNYINTELLELFDIDIDIDISGENTISHTFSNTSNTIIASAPISNYGNSEESHANAGGRPYGTVLRKGDILDIFNMKNIGFGDGSVIRAHLSSDWISTIDASSQLVPGDQLVLTNPANIPPYIYINNGVNKYGKIPYDITFKLKDDGNGETFYQNSFGGEDISGKNIIKYRDYFYIKRWRGKLEWLMRLWSYPKNRINTPGGGRTLTWAEVDLQDGGDIMVLEREGNNFSSAGYGDTDWDSNNHLTNNNIENFIHYFHFDENTGPFMVGGKMSMKYYIDISGHGVNDGMNEDIWTEGYYQDTGSAYIFVAGFNTNYNTLIPKTVEINDIIIQDATKISENLDIDWKDTVKINLKDHDTLNSTNYVEQLLKKLRYFGYSDFWQSGAYEARIAAEAAAAAVGTTEEASTAATAAAQANMIGWDSREEDDYIGFQKQYELKRIWKIKFNFEDIVGNVVPYPGLSYDKVWELEMNYTIKFSDIWWKEGHRTRKEIPYYTIGQYKHSVNDYEFFPNSWTTYNDVSNNYESELDYSNLANGKVKLWLRKTRGAVGSIEMDYFPGEYLGELSLNSTIKINNIQIGWKINLSIDIPSLDVSGNIKNVTYWCEDIFNKVIVDEDGEVDWPNAVDGVNNWSCLNGDLSANGEIVIEPVIGNIYVWNYDGKTGYTPINRIDASANALGQYEYCHQLKWYRSLSREEGTRPFIGFVEINSGLDVYGTTLKELTVIVSDVEYAILAVSKVGWNLIATHENEGSNAKFMDNIGIVDGDIIYGFNGVTFEPIKCLNHVTRGYKYWNVNAKGYWIKFKETGSIGYISDDL